jgi:hypothetical protein
MYRSLTKLLQKLLVKHAEAPFWFETWKECVRGGCQEQVQAKDLCRAAAPANSEHK